MTKDKQSQLLNACNEYLQHLSARIKKDIKDNSEVDLLLIKNDPAVKKLRLQDKNLELACLKYEIVSSLKNNVGDEAAFSAKLAEKRTFLQTRNDSDAVVFLKVLATILSFGLLPAFGLWKVEGHAFCNKVDKLVHESSPVYNGL